MPLQIWRLNSHSVSTLRKSSLNVTSFRHSNNDLIDANSVIIICMSASKTNVKNYNNKTTKANEISYKILTYAKKSHYILMFDSMHYSSFLYEFSRITLNICLSQTFYCHNNLSLNKKKIYHVNIWMKTLLPYYFHSSKLPVVLRQILLTPTVFEF